MKKTLSIEWIIEIQNDGTFYTTYQILHLEKHLPKQIKLRVGVDCGGLDELGIAYILDPSVDTLSWRRNMDPDQEGRISLYPKDHISRNQGTAKRFTRSNIWGEMPVTSWGEDMRDDILILGVMMENIMEVMISKVPKRMLQKRMFIMRTELKYRMHLMAKKMLVKSEC